MSSTASPPSGPPNNDDAVSIRRLVNDEIARAAEALDGIDGTQFEFLCECGELSCNRSVLMAVAAYRASAPGSVVDHAVPETRRSAGLDSAFVAAADAGFLSPLA